jgi:urease accessory protein UreF
MARKGLFDPNIFDPAIFDTGDASLDSYDWTGIGTRLEESPEVVATIRDKIAELDRLIEATRLTNSEKDRAKSITAALISLVSSPQPEWRAIVELLNSPIITAVCNATAVAMLAIGTVRLIVGLG